MGDASASTSAPATPTSTLICREDGNDLFSADPADDDGGGGSGGDWELSIADDDHVLLMDRDDEYLALMLSKERCAGGGGGGERGDEEEEMVEEWMKNARAWCVGWIVKVVSRLLLSLSPP